MKKENKNLIMGLVIGAVAIVVIFFWLFEFKPNLNNDTDMNVKEIAGLYDMVTIGDLDFKLTLVVLQHGKRSSTEYYDIMVWYSTVANNGEIIEKVSDCGGLLFEDGSQYKVSYDINEQCNYYEVVPGAKIVIYSIFYFSNSSNIPSYGLAKSWEEVPGSKITYFSQQNQGLIKYIIDKKEIVYANESIG